MSKIDQKENKVNDKWNMDSHKLFWHLDRVEAWQKRRKVAPLSILIWVFQVDAIWRAHFVMGNSK